jgi:RHS repeat-associated protein
MVGVRFLQGTTVTLRYFHQDHLGSIAVITDQNGAVVERDAYDPWGKRRFWNNGADDPTGSIQSQTIRGFTGQEMLASVGLVHLNGRVYDPFIGRMTSADPVVGDPLNGQTWNRYSYVYNNPLAYADPTGYCPICLGTFLSRVANGIGKFLQRNPLVGQALVIAAAALCGPGEVICAGIAATTANFVVTGLSTGRLDMALKAAAISAATAAAFYGVGEMTGNFDGVLNPQLGGHGPLQFGSDAHLFNIAGHALVGCGAAVASGGTCGPGALSGAVPSLAGPVVNNLPFQAALVANGTLGGLASVAGGGKFANGAITGAFGYLFNAEGKKGGGKSLAAVAFDVLLWAITPTTANQGDFVGAWQTVPNNGMSDRAAAYQMQIAGSAPDQAFVVGNVRFDGYNGTSLLEAKGPGYAQFVGSNGQFEPWFEGSQKLVDQARSQLSVANGAPIEWHIAEPEAFTAIQKLFGASNITGINLVRTPARP